MNKTPIEWTDFTVNPFRFRNLETGKVGHHCDKISPGCKNCYSSTMQAGPYLSGLTFIETNKPKGELFLDENVLQQVLRRRKPARIFWCDMTDMFLADYPDEWIDRCFAVMALTPQHTHQVLTKRADRMRAWFERDGPRKSDIAQFDLAGCLVNAAAQRMLATGPFNEETEQYPIPDTWLDKAPWLDLSGPMMLWPLPNVHLGVSVEDKQRYRERVPLLRDTAAALRWLSIEPLLEDLGQIDLSPYAVHDSYHGGIAGRVPGIDWVVVGGESGPDARPFDIEWARNTIAQCKAAGVACFVKQLGAKPFDSSRADIFFNGEFKPRHANVALDSAEVKYAEGVLGSEIVPACLRLKDRKGGDMSEWTEDLRVRQMPTVRS